MTTVTLDADYIQGDVILDATTYPNGSTALVLLDTDGQQLGVATVALDELPDDGNVFIKDWSENSGLLAALQRAGIVGSVIRAIPTGFVTVYEVELLASVAAGR